ETIDDTIETMEELIAETTELEPIPSSELIEIQRKTREDESGYTALKMSIAGVLWKSLEQNQITEAEIAQTLQDITSKFEEMDIEVIFQCIEIPRPLDEGLQRHSLNVCLLNGIMGKWLQMSQDEIKMLMTTGILYDIGITMISEELLKLPKFTEKQMELFQKITAISDVYDAMVSRRSYKHDGVPFDILEQFRNQRFAGLDPELVAVFLNNMLKRLKEVPVIMSDGKRGIVKYIPPNDIDHPVVQINHFVKQTNETWFCVRMQAKGSNEESGNAS
ncbi:MAG: hypothetical protein RSF88_11430, partial [Lachnospiraceae bacterium]